MKIGKFSIGKRLHGTKKFRFFYCPLLKETRKKYFWFFWWFGKHWYVCLRKKQRIKEEI